MAGDPARNRMATMRDIAAASGVSRSTVSRVLNDAPTRVPIAAETRERVHEAARKLGYRPNPLARALRGAPTMLIGAIVRDFSDPFFAGALEALAVETMNHGYNIVLGHVQGRLREGLALTTVLETRHCDAIIMLGDMQDQPRLLEDLRNAPEPVVALWQGDSPLEFPTVDIDDTAGVIAGVEHLIGLGHERIGFVSASLPGDNPQREDAFVEVMTARFGALPDGYVQRCPNTLAGGEAALRSLLACPSRRPRSPVRQTSPRSASCTPLTASAGPSPTTSRCRLRRPHVFRLHHAGAHDAAYAHERDRGRRGQAAVELARDHAASRAPRVTMFEPSLIVRKSTAPPMRRRGLQPLQQPEAGPVGRG